MIDVFTHMIQGTDHLTQPFALRDLTQPAATTVRQDHFSRLSVRLINH